MKVAIVLVVLLFASQASACLWDYDTLYEEEQGVEDIRDVIVGNFARNPPRYYEMRLARVSKLLETNPDNLDLYDDASVSCDRLHRVDEAIGWQEKKLAAMARLKYDPKEHAQPNHRYRHLANIGTHYAHRWLMNEKKWDDLSDLTKARDFVSKAIKEYPDAHFGREKYQLLAIECIIRQSADKPTSRYRMLEMIDLKMGDEKSIEAAEGIAGLIRLGAGWNSPDLFKCLGCAFKKAGRPQLAKLAELRVQELIEGGSIPILPLIGPNHDYTEVDWDSSCGIYMREYEDAEVAFPRYREIVKEWHTERTEFVNSQFAAGLHPDTNDDFWSGFIRSPKRAELPAADEITGNTWGVNPQTVWFAVLFGLLGVLFVVGLFFVKKRPSKPNPSPS